VLKILAGLEALNRILGKYDYTFQSDFGQRQTK